MEEGRVLNTIGNVNEWMGNYDTARQYLEQGLQLCRETGNRRDEAYALCDLGMASYWQHDYAAAHAYLERSLLIFRDTRDNWESRTLSYLGWLFGSLGDYTQAKAYLERALDMDSRDPVPWNGLGLVHHHLGENEAARECFLRAIDLAVHYSRVLQMWARSLLGHALAGLHRLDEAADAYRQALDLFWRETGSQAEAMECLAGLARVSLAVGDAAHAQAETEEILAYLEIDPRLEGAVEPPRVYLTCYRVLRANADPRADEILERGYHLIQETALKIDGDALRRSYLENVPANREIVAAWETGSQHWAGRDAADHAGSTSG
jgi:tetratricopeptide (TPR) repeat protein